MATKKKLLQAAAGTAAAGGAGALNVEQVFSTYLYDGNGGSQVIENGINLGQSNSDGAAKFNNNNTIDVADSTDFAFGGGDWTVEAFAYPLTNDDFVVAGWGEDSSNRFDFGWQSSTFPRIRIGENGVQYQANASTSYDISNYLGTWVHLAAVRNGNTVTLYLNGTSVASVSYSEAGFPTPSTAGIGIGSRWYTTRTNLANPANGYISNFRIVKGTAVYTSNFTVPTSALTAITNTSLLCLQGDSPLSDNSGNSHTLSQNQYNTADVTASDFGPFDAADAGEGGLVWIKNRTSSNDNLLYDTERGANNYLSSNTASAEGTITSLSSFNANGFTVSGSGTYINGTAIDYASWTFRKAPKFFDVVTYTGTGSSLTIDHNLGVEPAVIIIKRTNTTGNWIVFTDVVDGTVDYLFLDATDASTDGSTLLSKTSTDFTLLQSFTLGNASGSEYVAYLFAHNDGDGDFGPTADQDIIKCGSYTGNGSGDGPEIDLGFEPQWIMIKRTDTTGGWFIIDTMRGWTDSSGDDPFLRAESSQQEYGNPQTRPLATGFQPTTTASSFNSSGGNYIYIAIRRGPMAVPTDATDVFDASYGTSNGNTPINLGFSTDTMLYKNTSGSDGYISTRLTGAQYMSPNSTAAEATGGDVYWDDMDGIAFNNASSFTSWIFYNWKRAPSFCDVVAYTGNGTAGRTVSHNLGVAPEMMWVKARDSVRNWSVYHSGLTGSTPAYRSALRLNTTNAELTNETYWNNYPDADNFYLDVNGGDGNVNGSGINYIAYLFASLDGVSKVGSFTSTGSDVSVDCGFSNGARFVMIKRTDAADNWWFWDTERGITSGADNRLALNTTTAAATGADNIDPYSAGFTITSGILGGAGNNFIFYAVA